MLNILFLHGWQSVPGGVKPTYLQQHGHLVINPKLDDDDFAVALQTAQAAFDLHRPDVVVGSSRGGAVAMNLRPHNAKLVLLCPAWKKWGTASQVPQNTILLHSPADDVIPFNDSVELARNSKATLIEVGSDHRLATPDALEVMLWACTLADSQDSIPTADDLYDSPKPTRKKSRANLNEEASYLCDSCGEQIVIPLDLTEGSSQTYTEDCPVCCHANVIHLHVDKHGQIHIDALPEQDY